ncbi:MAG: serine/threonine protein kinase, partial [Deltaproteobacteria bacterium]|nr:serine/threonine protein kinase [Deltaproteobacteria bacterium]
AVAAGRSLEEAAPFELVDGLPVAADEPEELRPAVGEVVASRYLIRRLVGCGAIGRVYEAEQLDLSRRVALKVLHPHLAEDPFHKRRFYREARMASWLNQPGSVIVYDHGEWDGQIYIAMEFLEGRSLEQIIYDEAPLAVARSADLVLQIGDVLAEAHGLGVLHRDLKPANIIVLPGPDGQERAKVVDFGMALLLDHQRHGPRHGKEELLVGTPAYMPPEQYLGEELDQRSDLYSLGVIFYEMLCGRLPFQGGIAEYLVQVLHKDPLPPSKINPEVKLPNSLEQLVLWAMAKQPRDRPASVEEFSRVLRAIQAILRVQAGTGRKQSPPPP